MCNLSALVLEKGIQQEKENSLYGIAKISREYGIPMETTLSKLKSEKEWEDSEVDRVVQQPGVRYPDGNNSVQIEI